MDALTVLEDVRHRRSLGPTKLSLLLMAGSVTDPRAGVGSALRRARDVRGLSLDEAARDTRLRVDQLDALEREDFDVLLGEVYVRGHYDRTPTTSGSMRTR